MGILGGVVRAVFIVAVIVGWPATALARPCVDAYFMCDGSYAKNLRQLRSEGKPAAWIRSHCRVELADPPNCDWRASGSGAATPASGGRAAPDPAAPEPAVESPPVVRDAKGKLGPTLAPTTPDPSAADVLPNDEPYRADLTAAAQRYKLPVHLLRAVMKVESNGNPQALSPKGAIGLMQLMPETAKGLGVDDPHDTHQNIFGGARFLRILANRFDGDMVKVLSAYHAGSLRVQGRDATPFAATDDYVRKILKLYYQMRDAASRAR